MFKLLLGRAGSGKTTAVLNRICQAEGARPQILLVPEQQSHEAERALCAAGEQSRLMERAVGLLAQRPMSRKELLDKLCVPPRQKREKYPYDKLDGGPDPALLQQQKEALRERAEGVADRLAGLGLLNDGEYARMVVRHYAAKGYGPRKIRDELYRRGCPGSSGRTPWTSGSRTAARLTSWPGRSSGGRSPRGKI